jgi:hypothetical protein
MAAGQIVAGSLIVFLGEAGMLAAAARTDSSQLVASALALGPLLGGFVVCGVGSSSKVYEGSCGPAIGGAYLGALLAIPAAYIGCSLDRGSGGPDSGDVCLGGAILGAAAGYVFGTSIGATVGWHLGKRPRGERPPAIAAMAAPATLTGAPASDAWPELRGRPAASAPQGTRVSFSLLSLQF